MIMQSQSKLLIQVTDLKKIVFAVSEVYLLVTGNYFVLRLCKEPALKLLKIARVHFYK